MEHDQAETRNDPGPPEAETADPDDGGRRTVHGHATAAPRPQRSAPSIRPGSLVLDGPPGACIRDDIGDEDGFAHSHHERRTDPGRDHKFAETPVALTVYSDPEVSVRV